MSSSKNDTEDPIEVHDDELHVRIENTYIPGKGNNPNPVSIFNASDFKINRDGEFYINYIAGPIVYGKINDKDVFVPEQNIRIGIESEYFVVRKDELTQQGLESAIHRIHCVNLKPGNIIKSSGTFNTDPSLYKPLDKLYTMEQIKQIMTHAANRNFSITGNSAVQRTLNLGLYMIYHRNTGKMYTSYEFVKAVFTDKTNKTKGYLVFKQSEPVRKRELIDLAPRVEEWKYLPVDNPASIMGRDYRIAKKRFEERTGQAFTEGETFGKVLDELKSRTRKSKASRTRTSKGGRRTKNRRKKRG